MVLETGNETLHKGCRHNLKTFILGHLLWPLSSNTSIPCGVQHHSISLLKIPRGIWVLLFPKTILLRSSWGIR